MGQRTRVHASRNKTSKSRADGKAIKSAALCALAISLPRVALADTTTINSAITGTQGPTSPPLNGGDTLTITATGSIQTTDFNNNGVSATGGSNTINNAGIISTSGNESKGINTTGGGSTIINSGSISTQGSSSRAIYATGGSNAIINTGTISTINSGGIRADGANNSITNSGTITSSNNEGITIIGNSNKLVNSGSIIAGGANRRGVLVVGDGNTIENSGSIISKNSYAIFLDGSGNSFNSINNFIAGAIYMGSGGVVNFTTGANYSKLYTFEGSSLSINGSGPVPLFINRSSQQAATYDPTIFASSSDALADLTNTISSMIPSRFNGMDSQHPIWAQGFGMTSNYSGTTATLERHYVLSGVAMGYDVKRGKDLTLGLLGGYGQTNLTADGITAQSFNNSSDGGFLGLYGQKRWGDTSVDFALNGGVQSFQQQRYVNDNLAYLGNSSTNSSYQGWWFAPEAGITIKAGEIQGWSVLPTARLRYAQQWMGSYTESGGGSANATVNGRNVAIGQSFVGLGTRRTLKTTLGKNTKMVLEGQVGYMYRGVVGDDTVNVTMIGQSLSLPTETSSRNAVAVSAGVTVDLSSAVALKIRGDAAAGGGINYVGGGWAGLSVKF